METIIKHRWVIINAQGRRRPTRYHMTEAEARAVDQTAEIVPGTQVVIDVPAAGYPGHHQVAGVGPPDGVRSTAPSPDDPPR